MKEYRDQHKHYLGDSMIAWWLQVVPRIKLFHFVHHKISTLQQLTSDQAMVWYVQDLARSTTHDETHESRANRFLTSSWILTSNFHTILPTNGTTKRSGVKSKVIAHHDVNHLLPINWFAAYCCFDRESVSYSRHNRNGSFALHIGYWLLYEWYDG